MSHSHAPISQTIESLQQIMARDAVVMERLDIERKRLKKQNRKLRVKLLYTRLKK